MTKVNNRKVIQRLAFRELKNNPKMNFVVILSIILTCILFTALTSVGGSLINGIQQETMRQVGSDRMAGLKCVLPEDYEKVKADNATRDVVYRIIVGQVANDDLKNISAEVNCAGDENSAKALFCNPTTGRLPQDYDEIAVSTLVLDELKIPHELGTIIPIKLDIDGDISKHEFKLCGYWQGEKVAMAQECWVSRAFADKYAPTPTERFNTNEYPTYAGYWQVDFNYANTWDIEGKTDKLMARLYGDSDAVPDTGINWAYTTSSVDGGMLAGGTLLILVIFTAGYLIIYNIFYINISANIRSYGLLKTIGTTSKQIRRMVQIQAEVYCALGIPFGLMIGILSGKVLFGAIMTTLNIYSAESYAVNAKLLAMICLISSAFTFFTVMVSCKKPCKIAGNVSPIEALRYNETNISAKKKDKKTGSITPFSVARNNMSRSRKKTIVVVLSLTLSMVLVNTLVTFLNGVDMDKFISYQITGDFIVKQSDTSVTDPDDLRKITPEQTECFSEIDGVKELSAVYYSHGNVRLSGDAMEKAEKLYEKYADIEKWEEAYESEDYSLWESRGFENYFSLRLLAKGPLNGEKGMLDSDIYGISPDLLVYLEPIKGNLDKEKFATGNYALVFTSYIRIEDEKNIDDDFYKPGDILTLSSDDKSKSYEVMAVCDIPYALSTQRYSTIYGHVLIPDSEYFDLTDNHNAMSLMINAEENRFDDVNTQISNIVENNDNIIMKNKHDYADEYADFVNMIKLVGGTLSGILALIGILNFVNAVVTGIISRKRELAMMNAIGMTGSQLKKMLMWEGIHYAVLTAICSLIIGTLFSYFVVNTITGDMFFFTYHFTILPMLICVTMLLLLSAVIPSVAYHAVCRDSVVNRLREN
ncbi:MAG TPA: hypothetical protein DCO72_03810 [Ruminococcus sp.]|nr:hypothetical protein [Ruminococcus sp.]